MKSRQAVIQFRPGGVRVSPGHSHSERHLDSALRELLAGIEGYLTTGCKGGTPESDALVEAMERAESLVGERGVAA